MYQSFISQSCKLLPPSWSPPWASWTWRSSWCSPWTWWPTPAPWWPSGSPKNCVGRLQAILSKWHKRMEHMEDRLGDDTGSGLLRTCWPWTGSGSPWTWGQGQSFLSLFSSIHCLTTLIMMSRHNFGQILTPLDAPGHADGLVGLEPGGHAHEEVL